MLFISQQLFLETIVVVWISSGKSLVDPLIHFHFRIQKNHPLPSQPAKSMVQTPPLLFGSSLSSCISCGDFMGQLSTTISVINQGWICHGRKGACDSPQNEFLLPDKYWSNIHVSAQLQYPYWSWIQPSLLLCFYVLWFNPTYAISSLVTSAQLGWPCISIFWWSSPSVIWRHQPIPTLHSWVLFQC